MTLKVIIMLIDFLKLKFSNTMAIVFLTDIDVGGDGFTREVL